jgi:anti-sigma B factor antagonist
LRERRDVAITFEDVNESLRRIALSGRMDIPGTGEIETRFAALASASARRVVVDLTAVSFLASIGIRALISNAKALQQKGGRLVLHVGQNEAVAKTLVATGIDALIPMYQDVGEAERAALA